MAVREHRIESWFGRNLIEGVPEQYLVRAERLRGSLRDSARIVLDCVPPGAEQSRTITRLRDALDSALRAMKCDP